MKKQVMQFFLYMHIGEPSECISMYKEYLDSQACLQDHTTWVSLSVGASRIAVSCQYVQYFIARESPSVTAFPASLSESCVTGGMPFSYVALPNNFLN